MDGPGELARMLEAAPACHHPQAGVRLVQSCRRERFGE